MCQDNGNSKTKNEELFEYNLKRLNKAIKKGEVLLKKKENEIIREI